MFPAKGLFLTTVALSLSACSSGGGSSGGGGGTPTTPTGPSYETLSSTAPVTSNLKGVATRVSQGTLIPTFVSVSGSQRHDSGALTLSDGTTSIADQDGRNSRGEYTSGTTRLTTGDVRNTLTTDIAAGYEYVSLFQLDDTGTGSSTTGVYGIATDPTDVPTTGSATYRGRANVTANNQQTGSSYLASMSNGDSTVTANFGADTVDVEMNNFRKTDLFGNISSAPIDTMNITGMRISGNEFSGGTVTTHLNGNQVDVVGSGATQSASGVFYGHDAANSIPDEVGGQAVISNGTNAFVQGVFVAD